MVFINACSTISHQNTFRTKNWLDRLPKLGDEHQLLEPNYREHFNITGLRRMSKLTRASMSCALDCIEQASVVHLDAIIIGTGLGCLVDTEKFLTNLITINGLIPPTSFINSTHNTVAGQISIGLDNHSYNCTHTHKNLSFENALLDGILCLEEDAKNVLVGAFEEKIPFLDDIVDHYGLNYLEKRLTQGSSFFILSQEPCSSAQAQIIDCTTFALNEMSSMELVDHFLNENNLSILAIDLILTSDYNLDENKNLFKGMNCLNIQDYSGVNYTNSAFGLHLAADILSSNCEHFDRPIHTILVYNRLYKNHGLTLVRSIEA